MIWREEALGFLRDVLLICAGGVLVKYGVLWAILLGLVGLLVLGFVEVLRRRRDPDR